MKKTISGLYAVTREYAQTSELVAAVEKALEGGAGIVQYRAKNLDAARRVRDTAALRTLCDRFDACFIVNDDFVLAHRCDADGVHLGANDGAIAAAREVVGDKLVGVSCYDSLDLARDAVRRGADYIAFGSVFPSLTKPGAVHAPLSLITEARAVLSVPIVAIGGITLESAVSVLEAGADAIAVIEAVFGEADISAAARGFVQLFPVKLPCP